MCVKGTVAIRNQYHTAIIKSLQLFDPVVRLIIFIDNNSPDSDICTKLLLLASQVYEHPLLTKIVRKVDKIVNIKSLLDNYLSL